MSDPDPSASNNFQINGVASPHTSEGESAVCLESFNTPMPSHQYILKDIEYTYGHMAPLPLSALSLEIQFFGERQDKILGGY